MGICCVLSLASKEQLDTVPCPRAVSGLEGAAKEQLQQKVGGGAEDLQTVAAES